MTPFEEQISTELQEKLAAIEHQRWSDWQKYVFSLCVPYGSGMFIPEPFVKRWQRQIDTPYAKLNEKEKDSDREQVDRYLPLILEFLSRQRTALLTEIEGRREVISDHHEKVYLECPRCCEILATNKVLDDLTAFLTGRISVQTPQ